MEQCRVSHPGAEIQAGLLHPLTHAQDRICLPPLWMLLSWVQMLVGTMWGPLDGLWDGYRVGVV